MRSGIAFSEDYLDPAAEVRLLEQAIGWAPRRDPAVPGTMYDFLLTLRAKGPHGGPFEYRSCESDVLGWVCEAAAGTRMPELMSGLVWSRLGAEFDANIGVDSAGTGMFDGGISAALRDLARFGAMIGAERHLADRRAGRARGLDRGHRHRRPRLARGVRRRPGRQRHARRHVPQPVLAALPRTRTCCCAWASTAR